MMKEAESDIANSEGLCGKRALLQLSCELNASLECI